MHLWGIDRLGWRGLAAGLCTGLILTVLGLALGHSFWAHGEDAPSAITAGPAVVLSLAKGGKVRGALLEFRDGKVRLKPDGESAERTFASGEVIDVDFAPEEPEAAPDPALRPVQRDPKSGSLDGHKAPDAQTKDEPKRTLADSFWKRRLAVEERRKRYMEFVKPRIEERLAPEERKRFHELAWREALLAPAERKELEILRQKLGLMDPDAVRKLISETMEEARQAQRMGTLSDFSESHLKRLRTATTDEERRRHIASVFAGARVNGPESVPPFKELAVILMRSTGAPPASVEEQVKDLRAMYELFCDEVERLDAPPRTR